MNIFDHFNRLPHDKVVEVAEFIEFLYQKHEEISLPDFFQLIPEDNLSIDKILKKYQDPLNFFYKP